MSYDLSFVVDVAHNFILAVWYCCFVEVWCCPTWMIQFCLFGEAFFVLKWKTRPWNLFLTGQKGVNKLFTNLHQNGKTPFYLIFSLSSFGLSWKMFWHSFARQAFGRSLFLFYFSVILKVVPIQHNTLPLSSLSQIKQGLLLNITQEQHEQQQEHFEQYQ